MSWVITAIAVSSVISASFKRRESQERAIEIDMQADQEKIAAEGRELQRRQQLNKVLASNIVGLTGAGIAGEGTPASLSLASAKQASISEGIESLSDRLRQAQLKRQAATTRKAGDVAAASTLLKGVTQIAGVA